MKTIDDLRQFYQDSLIPDLEVLEIERKKASRYVILVVIFVGGIIAVGLSVGVLYLHLPVVAVMIPAVLCLIIGGFVAGMAIRAYSKNFKSRIIGKLVRFIDPNLAYYPDRCIPKSTFMLSKIFTTKPNRYKGDDLVSGKVGATQIQFSELHAEHQSGSGKNKHRYTIFRGLFFVGDFNKDFVGWVVVLPDTAERLFGRIGQKLQALNVFRGNLIKLEDPEFERHFVVYGKDQIETRYVLSTSLMERILQFKQKTGKKVYLSFVGSMIFVAVAYARNLFEPRLFKTLLDFEPIREYFEDLQLAVGIVEELNLNTRIWSKA